MDINLTLFGEMLTFAVLVWITMKYIWPPVMRTMQERQQKIADGLAAAKRGQQALEQANKYVVTQMQQAKSQVEVVLKQATIQASALIEASKNKAKDEYEKILDKARIELTQEINTTKRQLQQELSVLVIAATEKILQQKVDAVTQQKLIDQLIAGIKIVINNLTVVRPYTRAIFALALRDQKLDEWQNALNISAQAVTACKEKILLNNPKAAKQLLDFFYEINKNFFVVYNLIKLLMKHNQLELLPDITADYQQLLLTHKKTLEVKIASAFELTAIQKADIMQALQSRYQQQILPQYTVDSGLIGGAIIYIAGQIVDGSIKGMLQRLKQKLCN